MEAWLTKARANKLPVSWFDLVETISPSTYTTTECLIGNVNVVVLARDSSAKCPQCRS